MSRPGAGTRLSGAGQPPRRAAALPCGRVCISGGSKPLPGQEGSSGLGSLPRSVCIPCPPRPPVAPAPLPPGLTPSCPSISAPVLRLRFQTRWLPVLHWGCNGLTTPQGLCVCPPSTSALVHQCGHGPGLLWALLTPRSLLCPQPASALQLLSLFLSPPGFGGSSPGISAPRVSWCPAISPCQPPSHPSTSLSLFECHCPIFTYLTS